MGRIEKAVIFTILLWIDRPGVLAQGTNQKEYEALCEVYRIISMPIKMDTELSVLQSLQEKLLDLNMSTSPLEWFNLFTTGSESETKKRERNSPDKPSNTQEETRQWEASAKRILEKSSQIPGLVELPDGLTKRLANAKIRRAIGAFGELQTEFSTLERKMVDEVEKINKLFNQTLTGQDTNTYVTAPGDTTTFAAAAIANACGAAHETGVSLANTMACLCEKAGGGNMDRGCVSGHAAQNWAAASTAETQVKDLLSKCPDQKGTSGPAHRAIYQAVAHFLLLLGKQQTNAADTGYVLGTTAAGTCGGGAGESCANFAKHLKGEAAKGIPWVNKLEEAAALLEKLGVQKANRHLLVERARFLMESARMFYEEALVNHPPQKAVTESEMLTPTETKDPNTPVTAQSATHQAALSSRINPTTLLTLVILAQN